MIGYCPKCYTQGVKREKRPNGNDECENGHIYPSKDSLSLDDLSKVKEMIKNTKNVRLIEEHIAHCTMLVKEVQRYMEMGDYSEDIVSDTVETSSMTLPAVLGRTLTVEIGQQIVNAIDEHVAIYRRKLAKLSGTTEPLKVGDEIKVKSKMVGLRHMAGRVYKIDSITDNGNIIVNGTLVHRDEVEPA